jgi:ring-1,2-phenylacetyl-CoA epoxidase subunit PaaE
MQGAKRARVRQWRRDVEMVWKELRGQRPRPFMVRRRAGAVPAGLATRKVRVASVRRETADAMTFVLEATDGAPLTWLPGQFFTLLVRTEDGATHRRAYSASAPAAEDGRLPITVKRVDGGRVSSFLHERVGAGDTLEVLGPSGAFVVPSAPAPRTLVLVGGGSGITPLAAILQATLAAPDGARVHLVHASRRAEDAIFAAALAALAERHSRRFTLHPAHGDTFDARTLPTLPPAEAEDALYFVCGPRPMMDAVRATLLERGVRAERIREEHFASPVRSDAAAASTVQPLLVRHASGPARSLLVAPGATLLEAGLAARVPMPYSCAMGGCGACRVTLVSGTVTSDESFLTAEERARGDVLACCSRPTSPCTIELP